MTEQGRASQPIMHQIEYFVGMMGTVFLPFFPITLDVVLFISNVAGS